MTRFDNMTRRELGEMIGLACATDFDIQVVVDADMRTWVDKLPQLCSRIDLATLSRTAIHSSQDGPCEDKIGIRPCPELLRAARSFKVRAIEKYARIHASNGLIYLDNDVHIRPHAQAEFLAVFRAMRSANASVALARAKNCIPKGHETAGIPNTFCERNGGVLLVHGTSGTELAQAWSREFSKNLSPDGHDQVSLRKVLWDFTLADHNLLYELPERLNCRTACDSCAVIHVHNHKGAVRCELGADGQLFIAKPANGTEKKTCRPPGVIVVGVSRSGTSIATSILGRLGAHLGNVEQSRSDQNHPDGINELMSVKRVNKGIYDVDGLTWDELPRPLSPGTRTRRDLVDRAIDALAAFLDLGWDSCAPGAWWALKDPRFSITLPIWLAAARRLRLHVAILFVWREPGHFVDSRRRWQAMNSVALMEIVDEVCVQLAYTNLVSGAERRLDAITRLAHSISFWTSSSVNFSNAVNSTGRGSSGSLKSLSFGSSSSSSSAISSNISIHLLQAQQLRQ
jgi:hypothetical protein